MQSNDTLDRILDQLKALNQNIESLRNIESSVQSIAAIVNKIEKSLAQIAYGNKSQ